MFFEGHNSIFGMTLLFPNLSVQGMQPLDIPGHADESPFAFGCLVASHLETPESHDCLDDAEYWL